MIPAMILKMHRAKQRGDKQVILWGSGRPRRECLHVDDLARAICLLMELPRRRYCEIVRSYPLINIGFGSDVTIKSLASTVAEAVGFDGEIVYDTEKPDGVFSKLLNSQFIHSLGWRPEIDLKTGITKTYKEIESHLNSF